MKKSKNTAEITKKSRLRNILANIKKSQKEFLKRRPHRSFRLTKRRDYNRSLKLPGYIALTAQLFSVIGKNKRLFIGLMLFFAILTILSSSMMSQDAYEQLRVSVEDISKEGDFNSVVPTLALFWGVFSSQATGVSFGEAGSAQQIIGLMFGLFTWLSAVWLMRMVLAGNKPKIRDGIYASGGPVVALIILLFVLLIQLIPAAVALIAYNAANASGLLDQTAVLMLFGGGTILLVTLSLYWAVSTIVAMVIITLPGMYPLQALRLAGDLVIGRRMRIVLRLLWLVLLILLAWVVILIPVILIDSALKSAIPDLEWFPLVPLVALTLASATIVLSACYVYAFYRKVVADDAPPA